MNVQEVKLALVLPRFHTSPGINSVFSRRGHEFNVSDEVTLSPHQVTSCYLANLDFCLELFHALPQFLDHLNDNNFKITLGFAGCPAEQRMTALEASFRRFSSE